MIGGVLRQGTPVDIRPGMGVLTTFRHYGYKPWFAIGEFVDNSVSNFILDVSLLPDESLVVDVAFDEDRGTLTIRDNAGGIRPEDFSRALVAGTPPSDPSTLHQFGLGLKTAAFWWGARLHVETRSPGSTDVWTVNVDISGANAIPGESAESSVVTPTVRVDPDFPHGTLIAIDRLWPERALPTGRTLGKIRSYLSSIYRDYLRDGSLTLVVAGKELEPPESKVLVARRWDEPDGPEIEWRKSIDIEFSDDRHVTGWVGLLETGDTQNAGLVLTWRGKAIVGTGAGADDSNDAYRPRAVFGSSNSFESQRVFGELDVSCFPVTSRKDGIEWTDDDQDYLANQLHEQLEQEPLPLLRMARLYRKRIKADPDTTQTIVEQVAQSLSTSGLADFSKGLEGDEAVSGVSDGAVEDSTTDLRRREIRLRVEMASPFGRLSEMLIETRWGIEREDALTSRVEGSALVISINLGNRFMLNFAQRPQYDMEPILRLFAAIAVAEYQAVSEGVREAGRVSRIVNWHLARQLGQPLNAK